MNPVVPTLGRPSVRSFPAVDEDGMPPRPVGGGGGAGARLGSEPTPAVAASVGVEVEVRGGAMEELAEWSVESGFVGFLRKAGVLSFVRVGVRQYIYDRVSGVERRLTFKISSL